MEWCHGGLWGLSLDLQLGIYKGGKNGRSETCMYMLATCSTCASARMHKCMTDKIVQLFEVQNRLQATIRSK